MVLDKKCVSGPTPSFPDIGLYREPLLLLLRRLGVSCFETGIVPQVSSTRPPLIHCPRGVASSTGEGKHRLHLLSYAEV